MTRIVINAIAYALPDKVLSNEDLARENPSWDMNRLYERTGVSERRIAADGETALDLGHRAWQAMVERHLVAKEKIDALVFCTETPDYVLPPNSCVLHQRLGLSTNVMAFDINLACSGFVYAVGLARSLLLSGTSKHVLIVTADTYSRLIHPGDRSSRCLFGDGAASTLLSLEGDGPNVVDISFGTSGAQFERFVVRAGGSRLPRSETTALEQVDRSGNVRSAEHIEMDGLGVLSFFNSVVPNAVRDLLSRNGLKPENVSRYVFHQASRVAVDGIARNLNLNSEQVVFDMETLGNLVSSSIPVALARAITSGRIVPGQTAVLCGFGVGLSWATALIRL